MRLPTLPIIIIMIISTIIDMMVFRPMLTRLQYRKWRRIFDICMNLLNMEMLMILAFPKKATDDAGLSILMWGLFCYMTILIPKIVMAIIIGIRALLSKILNRPLKGLVTASLSIGTIMFIAMWWGAFVTRFSIDINDVEVPIENLPASFDGYRIVQISDMHCGTYGSDPSYLMKVVTEINDLHPDLIVFTGDIVNRHSSELPPFAKTLSALKATDGVWSVMGNHDYGDYYQWPNDDAKAEDVAALKTIQSDMGWNMLNNSHTFLHRDNDSIALIGVENIGDPPFHIYGSLKKAYNDISDNNTKILLSHNPAHWNDSIANRPDANIALTLSGHTHAMQIKIAGQSPAAMRYPTWGGLYNDTYDRHLYVNIGIGTVGFPSRIGATPEVTVLTLKSK